MPREPLLKKSPQRIGEILVQRGWISNEALGRALDVQQHPRLRRVGEILKSSGQVTEDQLAQALAEQYHLEYIDLARLATGWTIDRELYTFKWKHLRILPMRDPENHSWLLVTEATADEKLLLQFETTVDLSRIRFGVAATTVLEQVLFENPATNEAEFPPVMQNLALPSPAEPPSGGRHEGVPGLAALDVPQVLRIVGALWGQSAAELQRNAVLTLGTGPRFRIEVHQIVPEHEGELPPGYVPQITSRLGRAFEVAVTVPPTTVPGTPPELAWPPVWPPPDLVDSVKPILEAACRVPPALRASPYSLRWMGTRSTTRDALNAHLIAMAGVSLGHARIDDHSELWSAVRARTRGLDANQAARQDWDRWKSVQAPLLDIGAGHVLALACLATGFLPATLASAMQLEIEDGPVFTLELCKKPGAPAGDPAGLTLRVIRPPLAAS